jgi:hypothetical protein
MSAKALASVATLMASLLASSWPPPVNSEMRLPRPSTRSSSMWRPYIWKFALK